MTRQEFMQIPGQAVAGLVLGFSVALSIAFFFYVLNTLHLILKSRRYRDPELPYGKSKPRLDAPRKRR